MNLSKRITALCATPHSALQAIHLFIQHGQATSSALLAIYDRVMADNDVDGAYYLASFAQTVDDLPFDGAVLVEMVMTQGDENMKLALLEKLPKGVRVQYLNG